MIPCEIYSKAGITLPYLIDIHHEKWVEGNETNYRYTKKYVVLNSEVNKFIDEAPLEYEGKGLSSTSREDNGRLTIVTLVYGEAFDAEYDGFLEWWTTSQGLWTYHIRKRIKNNITAIRNFCEDCLIPRYRLENDFASAIPEPGAEYIYGEASWSEKSGEDDTQEGGGGGDWGDDTPEQETVDSVQFSSSTEQIPIPPLVYAKYQMNIDEGKVLSIYSVMQRADSGEIVYKKSGDMGGLIKSDGWYSVDRNPQAWSESTTEGGDVTPEEITNLKYHMGNVAPITVPVIRCTISKTTKAKDKITMNSLSAKLGNAGSTSATVSAGGLSLPAPEGIKKACSPYSVEVSWMDEGTGFDTTSVELRKNQLGRSYYKGTLTQSYRTVVKLSGYCPGTTENQAL